MDDKQIALLAAALTFTNLGPRDIDSELIINRANILLAWLRKPKEEMKPLPIGFRF